jgi:hypothetical protein
MRGTEAKADGIGTCGAEAEDEAEAEAEAEPPAIAAAAGRRGGARELSPPPKPRRARGGLS